MSEEFVNQNKSWEDMDREIHEIYDKIDFENPDDPGLQALEEYMAANPGSFRLIFDFARVVQDKIIEATYTDPTLQVCVQANANHILSEMGYEEAPMLECLIMDNLINWWLRLQLLELGIAALHESTKNDRSEIDYFEDRLGVTQMRFMRACVSLVRIRKITSQTTALQVKIATDKGQQVNVAEDVTKSGDKNKKKSG